MAVAAPLDCDTGRDLNERIASLPKRGRALLVLDLADCPLIDSAGCEALLDACDAITDRDGVVCLAAVPPLCSDILAATGVGDSFASHPSVRDAVLDLAR